MWDLAIKHNYKLGPRFENIAFDLYVGMQTTSRPPFIEQMFYNAVWENDSPIRLEIVDILPDGDERQQDIGSDLFAYMSLNLMCYLSSENPYIPLSKATIINPPSTAIW